VRVVATAVVGITDGETVFGLTPSELVSWEDPDPVRGGATAVLDSTNGVTPVGVIPSERVSWEDPDSVRGVATAVVGITDGETPVEGSNSVLVAGEGFRYNSAISTAPATSNTTARRATPTRIYLFIREW
jgi:hypothetical protein